MNAGLSVGIEFFKYLDNIIALGFGTTIDLPREIKKKELKGSMSYLPIYVGTKTRTPLHGLDGTYAFLSDIPDIILSANFVKSFMLSFQLQIMC
jgi:hypothetical protein